VSEEGSTETIQTILSVGPSHRRTGLGHRRADCGADIEQETASLFIVHIEHGSTSTCRHRTNDSLSRKAAKNGNVNQRETQRERESERAREREREREREKKRERERDR
jgi:hypothetical protein